MNTLASFSDEQLQAELQRRGARDTRPQPLPSPDFSKLIETAQHCMGEAIAQHYWDEDNDHYVYEAAMIAIYGPAFFDWFKAFRS